MKRLINIGISICLVCMMALISCSKNEEQDISGQEGKTYAVTYRITARSISDPNSTDEEAMKKVLLLIVSADNKIEKRVFETFSVMKQEYQVEVQLTPGAKTVYGFANLSDGMITAAGLNATEGSSMPDLSNVSTSIANGLEIDAATESYLPMSNKTTFTVGNSSGQTFGMELIRMLCKIKMNFKNETGHAISLKNIILSSVTTSPVYLLPRSDGEVPPEFPSGKTFGDYTYTFIGTPSFFDKNELNDFSFYFNESQVLDNGWFKLTLNTLREGVTDEMRMSITNLSYLNRNDYLPLDIILTDYKLELNVRSYPPIGGYPAAVTTTSDGYHCTFPGGGSFVIVPKLINLSTGSTVTVSDADWAFTYTDLTVSVFDETPSLKDGEIKGTLKSSGSGEALCTISVQVLSSESILRTLSYKIYIGQN